VITLHHLREDSPFIVNADLIETAEARPDTTVLLTTGKRLLVRETPAEIVALVLEFRRRAQAGPFAITNDH
jgi:flagellar protein FlbD